ncbi:hypothetical protein HK413_08445 [Mucilaginibacter sp. S1162]|uniref:Uncharacterized protein n=1 Tax=Mucilaginibacter humi TaxID=2732510 RepID=A0ABX1W1R4_9SPHI|nr:hypothetical protein [Mucilaginibacter humi]NNU34167.1 hypothetical protein [Mucilaginibacter humi]
MQRRHFLQLTSTATVALLLSRLTYATSAQTTAIALPNEVWAQSGSEWFKLTGSNGTKYSYKDIEVTIKINGNAKGVYITSPTRQLNAVRLSRNIKCLQAQCFWAITGNAHTATCNGKKIRPMLKIHGMY